MNHGFLFTLLLATAGLAFAQEVPPAKDAAIAVTPTPGTGDVARIPEAVHALDIATDVKKGMHYIPRISDPLTGSNYKDALKGYGNFVKGADTAVDLVKGYYRDGWAGVGTEAAGAAARELRDQAIKAGASVLVESTGVATVAVPAAAATAAVAASMGAGVFIGNQIDARWGDDIYRGATSPAADWAYEAYDRYVLEPEREALGERLRERHRRAKAEHVAQINAANAAAARFDEPVASYSRSVAPDAFLEALLISQSSQFWVPYPRANPHGGGRGSSSPRTTTPTPAPGGPTGGNRRTCSPGPWTCGVP
ncbi:MAG: hypothetical protein ABIQ72_09875 [Usitatibacter sp.]